MCGDPDRTWYPQLSVCHVEAETAAANAWYDALHDDLPFHDGTRSHWGKERTRSTPYHYRDGVTIFVTEDDLKMGGDFLSALPTGDAKPTAADQSSP